MSNEASFPMKHVPSLRERRNEGRENEPWSFGSYRVNDQRLLLGPSE